MATSRLDSRILGGWWLPAFPQVMHFMAAKSHLAYDLSCANSSDFPTATLG